MKERKIVTIAILATSAFIVFVAAVVMIVLYLRRRCNKTAEVTDKRSIANNEMTLENGAAVTNLGLDEDKLVSATMGRTTHQPSQPAPAEPVVSPTAPPSEELDARLEQILHDAYADARQYAKFPNMP